MLVNGAGNQVFSHAALAADQHRHVRRRHSLHQRQHRLHLFALRHDVGVFVAPPERLAQGTVFFAQLVRVEFLANHEHQLSERKRFQHVVARASLHGVHGGLNRTDTRS